MNCICNISMQLCTCVNMQETIFVKTNSTPEKVTVILNASLMKMLHLCIARNLASSLFNLQVGLYGNGATV